MRKSPIAWQFIYIQIIAAFIALVTIATMEHAFDLYMPDKLQKRNSRHKLPVEQVEKIQL